MRHNLSINPHFRKGARAPQGAGHLWSLAANALDLLPMRTQIMVGEEEEIHEAHVIECPKVRFGVLFCFYDTVTDIPTMIFGIIPFENI